MEGRLNDITWKFTASEEYSVASGYKDQFEGLLFSIMPVLIWKKWAPPKCKLFARLILQDRVWTSKRLQQCRWPNCGLCQLCKRESEYVEHLLFRCRYSLNIWNMLISWLGGYPRWKQRYGWPPIHFKSGGRLSSSSTGLRGNHPQLYHAQILGNLEQVECRNLLKYLH
jgi:hypothetical protein